MFDNYLTINRKQCLLKHGLQETYVQIDLVETIIKQVAPGELPVQLCSLNYFDTCPADNDCNLSVFSPKLTYCQTWGLLISTGVHIIMCCREIGLISHDTLKTLDSHGDYAL